MVTYGDCDCDRWPRVSPGSRRCPWVDQGPRRLNRKFNHTIYPLEIKCGTIQTSIYGGFPMAMSFPEGYNQQVIFQSKCDKISKDTNLVKNARGRKPLLPISCLEGWFKHYQYQWQCIYWSCTAKCILVLAGSVVSFTTAIASFLGS